MMDSIAFKTLKRPRSPNTYLLAPAGFCEQAEADQVSDVFAEPPAALFEKLLAVIEAEDNWAVKDRDEACGLIHFISTSRVMRYKDDVDILILPGDDGNGSSGSGSRLVVYSRSRVGHSDLGANKKRVKYLLGLLK